MVDANAAAKNLTLRTGGPAGGVVRADEMALRQVLINLVGNAIKYTDRGEVSVETDLRPRDFAVIRIRDTGVGIPAEQISRLGTPFHQVHDAFVQNRGGVGLGLSITRALLKEMGACLDIASAVGVGTTVTIRLPLAPAQAAAAAA